MPACEADVIRTTILRRHGHGREALPVPTLGALLHQPHWLRLYCDACGHRVAVALMPFVIR
jgi:hypothetical protein